MHARRAAISVLLTLAATTTACSGNSDSSTEASPTACKEVLAKQLDDAIQDGKKGGRPAACEGIDSQTLERLVGEVTTEWLDSGDADKAFTDALDSAFGDGIPVPEITETEAGTTEISDDCRTWIETELLDSSDSIDATPGYNACGGMSDAELDAAIEEVTNDLLEQDATPAS